MKQYPLGSICTIISTGPTKSAYLGRECTVVGLPGCSEQFPEQYRIEIQGDEGIWHAEHFRLQLKKFPPKTAAWCREVMKTVLMPLPVLTEETA